ncbi:unnamed protein product [Prunus armeniaca]|uniref:Uncharacterized protein n=1 Tax=Prunus armeniaca TaxID=36596 RepID=A0A6J5WIZ6_PRUAR|nr:unnamed protein product [Prunus armeniaca]
MERLLICSRRGKGRVIPALPNPNSTTIHCLHLFSVGSPLPSASLLQLSEWNLTHRHIVLLNVAAVSATWLFCSAITTLQAFKRPIQSLEKLMDVMREELPNTMVVVRLSGMEISDLTMELRDLGLPLPFHSCYCLICKCMVALANDSGKVQYQLEKRKKEREVVVRSNQGFGFNGGGGGGGKDDGATARILGNLALAIGLTYLSFTGQLGWILDAIVSIWVLSFI